MTCAKFAGKCRESLWPARQPKTTSLHVKPLGEKRDILGQSCNYNPMKKFVGLEQRRSKIRPNNLDKNTVSNSIVKNCFTAFGKIGSTCQETNCSSFRSSVNLMYSSFFSLLFCTKGGGRHFNLWWSGLWTVTWATLALFATVENDLESGAFVDRRLVSGDLHRLPAGYWLPWASARRRSRHHQHECEGFVESDTCRRTFLCEMHLWGILNHFSHFHAEIMKAWGPPCPICSSL